MKPRARLCKSGIFVALSSCALAPLLAAPLSTVENSTLSVPAANVAAASIAGSTNLVGSNFLCAAVTPVTQHGGSALLFNLQRWVSSYAAPIPASLESGASGLAVRADGNIVATGYTYGPTNGFDFLTLCYGPDGTTLWTNLYDGPAHGDDTAAFLAVGATGDVRVMGESARTATNFLLTDIALLRYASNGLPLWTNRYTSAATNGDSPLGLVVDASGNSYVALDSTYWLPSGGGTPLGETIIKYDPLGNALWTNLYPATAPDSGQGLHDVEVLNLDQAGNLLVAGVTGSPYYETGSSLEKFAGDGTAVWTNYQAFGVIWPLRSVLADRLGNVILTGESFVVSNSTLYYVVLKCSASGASLWTNSMIGPAYDGGGVPQTQLDPVGNIYLIGGSAGASSTGLYQILKLSSNGAPLWTNLNANFGTNNAVLEASGVDSVGNLYLSGYAPNPTNGSADYVTIKYSGGGQPLWTNRYDDAVGLADYPSAMAVDLTGNVYVTGQAQSVLTTVKYADLMFYTPPVNFTGTDTITDILTDNFGNSATGSLAVVVASGAFQFNLSPSATKLALAGFQFEVDGVPATNAVIIEASTDLIHWQPILTNAPANGSFQALDTTAAGFPQRFYRAIQSQ